MKTYTVHVLPSPGTQCLYLVVAVFCRFEFECFGPDLGSQVVSHPLSVPWFPLTESVDQSKAVFLTC